MLDSDKQQWTRKAHTVNDNCHQNCREYRICQLKYTLLIILVQIPLLDDRKNSPPKET